MFRRRSIAVALVAHVLQGCAYESETQPREVGLDIQAIRVCGEAINFYDPPVVCDKVLNPSSKSELCDDSLFAGQLEVSAAFYETSVAAGVVLHSDYHSCIHSAFGAAVRCDIFPFGDPRLPGRQQGDSDVSDAFVLLPGEQSQLIPLECPAEAPYPQEVRINAQVDRLLAVRDVVLD